MRLPSVAALLVSAVFLTGCSSAPSSVSQRENCPCVFSETWLDIVLAIETTQSMGDTGLDMVMAYLATALDDLVLNGKTISGQRANLAVLTFGNEATTVYNFGELSSVFQMFSDNKIQAKDDASSNVAGAITLASKMFEVAPRPNVAQVLILAMSSGNKYDESQVDKISGQFKEQGRKIVIVDYVQEGQHSNTNHYSIASPGYLIQTFEGDDNIGAMQSALCDANCFCGAGQVPYQTPSTDSERNAPKDGCYYFSNAQSMYKYAELACNKKGAIMATPTDKQKEAFLAKLAAKPTGGQVNFLFGYTNKESGYWRFADGSASSYTNWAVNEPMNNKPYAYYDQSVAKWKSATSSFSTYYTCQYVPCSTTWRGCLDFKAVV